MKSLIFGETIFDIFTNDATIGGAPFNFSAHLAVLENETYLLTALGKDDLGDIAMREAKRYGIKNEFIQRNEYKTGSCIVTLDKDGLPSYNVLENTAYDNIIITDEIIDSINALHADMFYFNTLIQRSEKSAKSLIKIIDSCSFDEIFCDINLRKDCFDAKSLRLCLEHATTVKISEEEGPFLYDLGLIDDKAEALPMAVAKMFPNIRLVLYTLGQNGSQAFCTDSDILYTSCTPGDVKVVSTVGAGDCFGASFMSLYMKTHSVKSALDFATKRADTVVASKGAIPF